MFAPATSNGISLDLQMPALEMVEEAICMHCMSSFDFSTDHLEAYLHVRICNVQWDCVDRFARARSNASFRRVYKCEAASQEYSLALVGSDSTGSTSFQKSKASSTTGFVFHGDSESYTENRNADFYW